MARKRSPEWRAVNLANAALEHFERGKLAQSYAEIHEARELFSALDASPEQREALAKCYSLAAQIDDREGRLDAALANYREAEALLMKDPENRETLGETLHDIGELLHDFGADIQARDYFLRAAESLRGTDSGADGRSRDAAAALGDTAESPADTIDRLRKTLSRYPSDHPQRYRHLYNLAASLADSNPTPWPEILSILGEAAAIQRAWTLDELVTLLNPLGRLNVPLDPLPDWVLGVTDAALSRSSQEQRRDLYAQALHIRGLFAASRRNFELALAHALEAIAQFDITMMETPSAGLRLFRSSLSGAARALALTIACGRQNAALVAELIESSRLQALPRPEVTDLVVAGGQASHIDNLMRAGRLALGRLHPVTVNGVSALRPFYPPESTGTAIPLERTLEALGGAAGIAWGCWAFDGRWYWCVLDGTRTSCGYEEPEADSPEANAILEYATVGREASVLDLLSSRFTRSYDTEEELAVQLGRWLVPAPLRAALERTDQPRVEGHVPRVVVFGNVTSDIPLATLAVENEGEGYPARLIERAVVCTAPPSVIVDGSRRRSPGDTDRSGQALAVLDPNSDLYFAATTEVGAKALKLIGQSANRQNLLSALSNQHSILVYSGHVGQHGYGGDSDDALELSNGPLPAGEMWLNEVIRVPDRVLLSACSSAGSAGGGSGEWLGLGAAFIAKGTSELVATKWPILDTRFTAEFDTLLASELANASDAAEVLRSAQVKALWRWRRSSHDYSERTAQHLDKSDYGIAFPGIWASYTAISLGHSFDPD